MPEKQQFHRTPGTSCVLFVVTKYDVW